MLFLGVGVHQEVVNVDDDVLQVTEYSPMSHWKEAGHPRSPMGEVIQWNWPFPRIAKAVSGCDVSSNFICQNPKVRSSVEKIFEFAHPMSPIHSVISFMEYLSM
jgi:hypothetical protein